MLNKPLGDDLRHDLICIVDALAALVAQCEGERRGEVGRIGGRETVGVIPYQRPLKPILEALYPKRSRSARRRSVSSPPNGWRPRQILEAIILRQRRKRC